MIEEQTIVLVDRSCGFCSDWERRLKKHATHEIVFDDLSRLPEYVQDASVRSALLSADSLIVIDRGKTKVHYDAVRTTFRKCNGAFPTIAFLMGLLPSAVGDIFYRAVSKNRHSLGSCDTTE